MRFSGFDDEWKSYKLGEIGLFKNGVNKSKEDFGSGYPFINLEDIFDKDYLLNKEYSLVKVSKKELKEYNLNKGDVLFVRSSVKPSGVGLTTVINENLINTVFSGFIIRFRENKQILDLNFKRYCFNITSFRNSLMSKSTTSANTNINQQSLSKLTINAPCIDEQKKIASFLEIIDKKIGLLNKKSEYYIKFKKYLMQQIFTQKLRFDDNCQYKTKQVKDFLIESKIEGIDDINKRLTVKLNLKGITVRESKTIEIEGATKQFIRKTGQFIYGKQNLHKGAFGIIPKELDGYLTSSDIPSFDFKGGIEPKWFYYYFARKSFYEKLENLSTGTGSKRISPKEFLNIKIIVPEFKEQHKIVCLLEKFDEKINGISNQIVQMNMFKKSLLQQMFVVQLILSLLQNKKHI